MERTRTFKWNDPAKSAVNSRNLSGIAYLTAMQKGVLPLPPLFHALDFQVESVHEGSVTFSFHPQEFHYNPIGSVHGGVISSILDSATGCAVHSILDTGVGYTTLEIKINFLKSVTTKQGLLKATGKIIHSGSRVVVAEAQLIDDKDTIFAHATSTCLILK
ncbi:MAG: aromatic compound degradation protein PaaI [Marivirga sp.]|nr:aromatic compound degradation protein PaaI [Marivirga sp.]